MDWLKDRELAENIGGFRVSPSITDDEGDGGDAKEKMMEKPGAYPTYDMGGGDLPITDKNRRNFSKKKCKSK
jgi:hypothetical protein